MEIFMRNIPYTADEVKMTLCLQSVLHTALFEPYATSPGVRMNFKVFLFKNRRDRHRGHSGCGALTLPSEDIGLAFLDTYGGRFPSQRILVDDRPIVFERSRNPPRPDNLGEIRLLPYRDPRAIREQDERRANLSMNVRLENVQFAWLCRDETLSVEWQWNSLSTESSGDWHDWLDETLEPSYCLRFNDVTHEIFVERHAENNMCRIATRYSRITSIETDSSTKPTIVLMLETPPSFEEVDIPSDLYGDHDPPAPKRRKLTSLNAEHASVAPFTWSILRVVCSSLSDLSSFKGMADVANLQFRDRHYPTEQRRLFSSRVLYEMEAWLSTLDWSVAFQCEMLRRERLLDTRELLELCPSIEELVATRRSHYSTEVLRQFGLNLRNLWVHEEEGSARSCFDRAKEAIHQVGPSPLAGAGNDGIFQCLHVNFTPTLMTLRGPFPDTSNRILRRYPNHHDSFLRVSFTDEEHLKFRFDHREVDGADFIDKRVGTILREGFTICGRRYDFLAYSQSALKQYTVWFVTPFFDATHGYVDAERIRASIGSEWPEDVRRCPARFAARLSQAFTATESAVFVTPDQVERMDDIERNTYCFSDGNGPLSQEMANAIHDALQRRTVRSNRGRRVPSVFQIRIQGAKGVLSVNSTLSGLKIGLRPSMVKFESIDNYEIEVARSFNRPTRMFLNRPLVMILAGLGVGFDVFLGLQRDAVEETESSAKTLKGAARLLETHGLGTAFTLPSTLLNLQKLGLEWKHAGDAPNSSGLQDAFTVRAMQYAVTHVLREMKYRARIPVPESWKLVGVVDVHDILEPHQIYACIVQGEGAAPEYLKGPILVSKSPTIHPGDVQMAEAIGAPPPGSPLKALFNCVVFSQRGERPLPNKLSGSDLDGDEYDLIPLPCLHPPKIAMAGEYPAAPKRRLRRDSTIDDVAAFVVDFINNDTLGLIATNFLLIADRDGIFDRDCVTLAELHSWAVDFPKSGEPVPLVRIPQPKIRIKPDWHAPEIMNTLSADFYESPSVLGELFRAIDLPALSATGHDSRAQQRRRKKQQTLSLEGAVERISLDTNSFDDPISVKLQRRLRPLVKLKCTDEMTSAMVNLFDHFAAELEHICFSYTLSRKAGARLNEEEVFMGTIVAKSTQPRMRRDLISGMREETRHVVHRIRKELEGGEEASISDSVNRSWTAWKVSILKDGVFGSKSFGWIALRAIFDCIKDLEEN